MNDVGKNVGVMARRHGVEKAARFDGDALAHPVRREKGGRISHYVGKVEQDTSQALVTLQDMRKHVARCTAYIHDAAQTAKRAMPLRTNVGVCMLNLLLI